MEEIKKFLDGKTNKELYEISYQSILHLCFDFFLYHIDSEEISIEDGNKFFIHFDECMEYEFSTRKEKYSDKEEDDQEVWYTKSGLQKLRFKTALAVYKKERLTNLFHDVTFGGKRIESDVKDLIKRFEYFTDSFHSYLPDNLMYYKLEHKTDGNKSDYQYALEMINNDPEDVMNDLEKYPLLVKQINDFTNIRSYKNFVIDLLNASPIPEYAVLTCYYLAKYFIEGYKNLISQNIKSGIKILKEILKYENMTEGRQSSRPFAFFGLIHYLLGKCYESGSGVKQDYKKAGKEYLLSAEGLWKKYLPALGDLYFYGKGIKQDYSKAYECYKDQKNSFYAVKYGFGLLSDEELDKKKKIILKNTDHIDDVSGESIFHDFDFKSKYYGNDDEDLNLSL